MRATKQRGYSLLEVLVALALATASLTFIQGWWLNYWQRAGWWQTLGQASSRQLEVHEGVGQLLAERCQPGLSHAEAIQWRLYLDQGRGCEQYDVRFNAVKGQLQKRRQGGRYVAFIDDVRDFSVVYGLAGEDNCMPQQWLTEVPEVLLPQVVLIDMRMQVALGAVAKPSMLPAGWHWQESGEQQGVWLDVTKLVALGCHLDA